MRAQAGSRRRSHRQASNGLGKTKAVALIPFFCCFVAFTTDSQAAKNGKGNGSDPPPTPIFITPARVAPGWSGTLELTGDAPDGESYEQSQGKSGKVITVAFSGQGITVSNVTVTNGTTLTLDISVATDAPLGSQSVTVTNPDGQSSTSVVDLITLTIDTDSNGIHDNWEAFHFGSTGIDPNADPDGDGISNRAEYLFGLNPGDATSNRAIIKPLDPGTGTFEYRRAKDQITGIVYRVMTSTDLSAWTEETAINETVVATDEHSETVQVGLPAGLLNNPKLYVRVSAE